MAYVQFKNDPDSFWVYGYSLCCFFGLIGLFAHLLKGAS
jgi:hypothetical protein